MKIQAYTLRGCPSCSHLKELFRRAEVEYEEIVVNVTMSKKDFLSSFPNVPGFPFVVIDDVPVGGLVDTVRLFVKEGLVSSNKKK